MPPQSWEWELKVYPKGFTSTSEDCRMVLYSNLILDHARPVEFQLSLGRVGPAARGFDSRPFR